MRVHGRIRLLTLAAILCFSQAALAADRRPDDRYTLFVELHRPYESNRATLRKMLKEEGHESFDESEREVSMVLTAAQIGKLFQGKVGMRKVEASASAGTITQPYLEGTRIPARFQKLIRRVYFDPQRG